MPVDRDPEGEACGSLMGLPACANVTRCSDSMLAVSAYGAEVDELLSG